MTPTPIPFGRLVAVELRKATDTRAARWLLGLTGAAVVFAMLAPVLAKHSIDQNYRTYLDFPTIGLATLLPVVALLMLTTEWTQRTVLTTFTQEPRRGRVFGAKITVSCLVAIGAAAFGGLVTLATVWLVEGGGRHLGHDVGAVQIGGFVLFVVLNMLIGAAFGAVLHNTAAAIVLYFVLPIGVGILGSVVGWVDNWLDPGTTFDWVLHGQWDGHALRVAASAGLWICVPLALGVVRTLRREVK